MHNISLSIEYAIRWRKLWRGGSFRSCLFVLLHRYIWAITNKQKLNINDSLHVYHISRYLMNENYLDHRWKCENVNVDSGEDPDEFGWGNDTVSTVCCTCTYNHIGLNFLAFAWYSSFSFLFLHLNMCGVFNA